MNKKEFLRLLQHKEVYPQVLELLVELGLIKIRNLNQQDGSTKMSLRMTLTQLGREYAQAGNVDLDPIFVREYRNLFPSGKKGDGKLVLDNLGWLFTHYDYTKDQIIKATENYIKTVDNKTYCQQADFFIYKNLEGGIIRNTILTFLEELEDEESSDSVDGYGWEVI
jgi:hypothetical protein